MNKYDELLNKKMKLGDLLEIIGEEFIATPTLSDFEDGMRNGLVSADIKENSHTNIFFKYIDSLNEYETLVNKARKEESFDETVMNDTNIEVTKIEYWTRD